ncbi:MAG: HmuY family protein [Bacteroidota bacterium]
MNRIAFLALAGALTLTACDSTDPEPDPIPLNVQTAADVEADLAIGFGPQGPVGRDLFTLFDLDTGQIVLSSNETDAATRAADSTGTAWDIGFRTTTIIVNSGISGPGSVEAQLLTETFASVTEAPAAGYLADGDNTCPAVQTPVGPAPGVPYAICTGSDNGWYNYNQPTNLVSPIPGRTIVLQTSEGNFAKIRILSYYQGNPVAPVTTPGDPNADASRYYTFEYVVQPDGSRGFETTVPDA